MRGKRTLLIFTAIVAVQFVATSAMAGTHAHNRSGFYLGVGAGMASADTESGSGASPIVVDLNREGGAAGNFRFGWAVMENMTLGLENSTWFRNYDISGTNIDANLKLNVTAFAMTFFPSNMGLYLRGGVGVGVTGIELKQGTTSVSGSEVGLGLIGAVGYEWRLTRLFAFGPQVEWAFMGTDGEETGSANFTSVTAQATWYW